MSVGDQYGSLVDRKDGGREMATTETNSEVEPDVLPPDPGPALVDGGPVSQDAAVTDSGERQPGGGLPSSPGDVPLGKPRGRWARFFSSGQKAPKAERTAPTTSERRPVGRPPKSGKRMSGAETLGDVWGGVGSLVVRNPAHVPLGRYMQFQAPVAGEMLDEAAAGTIVDKVALQPIVAARGRFDLIGAVFGPPALILAIERNPDRAELLMPMLRTSIRNALPLMVPAIKRIQVKEAKTAEAAADLFDSDPNYAAWVTDAEAAGVKAPDPADYILSMVFGGWVPPGTPAEPEPVAEPV